VFVVRPFTAGVARYLHLRNRHAERSSRTLQNVVVGLVVIALAIAAAPALFAWVQSANSQVDAHADGVCNDGLPDEGNWSSEPGVEG
jgi:hypothetical protein